MQSLSDRLKYLRKQTGFLQKDIAQKLNITTSAYGFYEQGKRIPDSNVLEKLAEIFNVSTDYLLGRTDNKVIDVVTDNPELLEFTRELYERDSTKKLLEQLKNKDDKTIYKVINIIKLIEDNESNEHNH